MWKKFKQNLRDGYWTKGTTWKFDWYIDVFFVEVMAFGDYPVRIDYEQPIVGDEFLTFSKEKIIIKKFKDFFSDKQKYNRLLKDQRNILKNAQSLIKKIQKERNVDLQRYERTQKNLSLLMASVSVVFDILISKKVKMLAKKYNIPEISLTDHIISRSSYTKLHESNEKLINLYKNYPSEFISSNFNYIKLNRVIKSKLSRHVTTYGWLNTGERSEKRWEEKDFVKQLENLINSSFQKRITDSEMFLKGFKKNDRLMIEAIIGINLNDNCAADKQIELDYLFQGFLKNKLERFYEEEILENLTFAEIKEIMDSPKKIKSYVGRTNHLRVVYPKQGTLYFKYFDDLTEFNSIKKLLISRKKRNKVIEGNVAYRGVVKGKVRIAITPKDLETFEKGEILVAIYTQPRYVTTMSKASAIVTDIGGITSHAAIIAREFRIPCIVGTGNATHVLKDGDFVLVDAEKGKVTKL